MLVNAGVKRCYGIVGDALNPVIDALRRNGNVDFVHVRNEEYGAFAAVAEAYFTGEPVAVCGTAGPGVVHLFNGLMDARKERAPVIAIAGDVGNQGDGYVFARGDESLSVLPGGFPLHRSTDQSRADTVGHRYGNTHVDNRERPYGHLDSRRCRRL
jgi:Thiamine pyrophosphate enzyme, N-terminal TPP binding domain